MRLEKGDGRFCSNTIGSFPTVPAARPTVVATDDNVVKLFKWVAQPQIITAVVGGKQIACCRVEGQIVWVTGAAALGGDWDLEVATGAIETAIPLSASVQASQVEPMPM